jgi:hypothetical protein
MPRRLVAACTFAVVLAACGGGETSSPDGTTPPTPPPTVGGVGVLPDTIPAPDVVAAVGDTDDDEVAVPASVDIGRPVDDDGVVLDTIAAQVQGNRLIAIGDSILASTATRYGGEMCEGLNPLGWDVEVDAEPGRSIEFGDQVLQDRIPDEPVFAQDFDAVIVHLGTNYDGDQDNYFNQLNEILFRVSPRPTIVMTVTEVRDDWFEVNDVIDQLARLYDNVTVVDWDRIAEFPGVLSGDGIHPTQAGETVLVDMLEVALGTVSDEPGECLPTDYTDDSLDQTLGR